MSITTRTNLATNPSAGLNATGYAAVAGTGGTAAIAWNSGAGYQGIPGYPRVTWTVATSAITGGISYTQAVMAAATQYTAQIWVRCSKAQSLALKVDFKDAATATVNTVTGSTVAVAANTWTRLTVTGTSGALVTNALFTALAVTGGSNWANTDWLDGEAILVETGAVVGTYFDGSFVNAGSVMYAWSGSANASTSTAKTYTPAIALVAKTDAPCPRVEVTITDLTPTANTVTVWRSADGKRQAVRGARKRTMTASDFVVDYEAPLNRALSYEVEVTAGVNALAAVTPVTVTLTSVTGWMQDPLVPSSAIPISGTGATDGSPSLRAQALQEFEYAAGMTLVDILGSPDWVALIGQRMSASNVDFSLVTEAAQQTTNLRNLIKNSGLLLVRPVQPWGTALPGLCYIASASPAELPVNTYWGGMVTNWAIKTSLVAAPTMNVLVPVWTYGDVQALWATYQQAQTALAAKTYLDVLKSPSGV